MIDNPKDAYDLIVIGSGAAGLTAAVTAQISGLRVLLLEATDKIGGSTAYSGGFQWLPNNHLIHAAGLGDSEDEALKYCSSAPGCKLDSARVASFVRTAPELAAFLERKAGIKFALSQAPDSFVEIAGGKTYRNIEPKIFPLKRLGRWQSHLRLPPMVMRVMINEVETLGFGKAFLRKTPVRWLRGEVAGGLSLVANLLEAALAAGVTVKCSAVAKELTKEGSRVAGVVAEIEGRGKVALTARCGVILATGGFEWNDELKRRFLPGPVEYPVSPPIQFGQGLLMAEAVGAQLLHTDEAWYWPAGRTGKGVTRLIMHERFMPHAIFVNGEGKRFVNEASHNVANSFYEKDLETGNLKNLPCWAIFDAQYRKRFPVLGSLLPFMPDPAWLPKGETLQELAEKIQVPPAGLEQAVARFNKQVAAGSDADFGRGSHAYDRYFIKVSGVSSCLGTIEKAPFYAVRVYPSTVGTKGGIAIDTDGRAIGRDGDPIDGLYAAGNVADRIFGPFTIGNGVTIASAATIGYRAALHAARRDAR